MNDKKYVKQYYQEHFHVTTSHELDGRVLGNIKMTLKESERNQTAGKQSNIWRIIMKSKITKFAAAALIIIAVIIGISQLGTPFDANKAFADVVDYFEQARTFSCKERIEWSEGVDERMIMLKEPDLERTENILSPISDLVGEVNIRDFGRRQKLQLNPVDKTGELREMSAEYRIDPDSGRLELSQLEHSVTYSIREQLLEANSGEVEDLGVVELEGRPVRVVQSQQDSRWLAKVWIDPATNLPVQVTFFSFEPGYSDQQWTYSSILIDVELDDELFSLEPPEGYTVQVHTSSRPDYKNKLATKMFYLFGACGSYAYKHDGVFPRELADLVTEGYIKEQVLANVLEPTDRPDGPPAFIRYRQPHPDSDNTTRETEVVFYEVFDMWSEVGIGAYVVCDGPRGKILYDEKLFEQYMKNWAPDKKYVSINMMHLQLRCIRFANEHTGQYPQTVTDLGEVGFSEEMLKNLQALPNESGEPALILYRVPDPDADASLEIVFYERYEHWEEDGVVVCFADIHCEIITDQNRFEELIK